MKHTGARIIIEELIRQGTDTVFGYPGGSVLNLYDELYKNSQRLTHVLAAHEQGAAHAADGYARVTGKAGVVIATSGPGATNLVTGIANAYLDSVPLIAITGNVAVNLLGRDSFQEVDIVGITQPIVKHNYIVRDVSKLEQTIREAFLIANSGRKGPVLIDVPKSVQTAECEYPQNAKITLQDKTARFTTDFSAAIEAIKASKRPYIYCGGGVTSSGAETKLLELSKRINAPIGLSMMGIGAVPYSYGLNLGMSGMHGRFASTIAQSEADLVIAAGVRFSDRATGNTEEYRRNCTVIHIDIDAAELSKNVTSEIGLCGDIKDVLSKLLAALPETRNEKWLDTIGALKEKETKSTAANEEFTPRNIITAVNRHFDDDAVVATDVGQHQMWTVQYYKFEKPRRLLTSGGLGTMGYGFGAAIGGCIGNGRKRTLLFTSDGSFGMNLNEMATAVSQNLPIVIILLNNGTLGMVRQWQTIFFNKHYSSTTLERKTNFPRLAEAFGAQGYAAENLAELDSILEKTAAQKGPVLIDCRIGIDERVLPMIPAGGTVRDIIIE